MSGEYDGKVRIGTKIDDSELYSDLEQLKSKLQAASGRLRDVMQGPIAAVQMLGRAFQQVGQIIGDTETEWANQEKTVAILNSTIKATGASAWTSSEKVQELANKLQKLTGYADDNILAMQNVLLGFKNIKGDNFDEAALQILNMSTVMKMDFTSAAQAVGKALDDPIAGVDSLTRQGFRFSAAQKEVLKDLVNTGHIAEAQKIILDELATTYGGAAEAAAAGGSAIKERLGTAINELKEGIGQFTTVALAPARKGLIDLVDGFTETFRVINENGSAPELLTKLATGLGAVTAGVAAFVLVSRSAAIIDALALAIEGLGKALFLGLGPWGIAAGVIAALIVAIMGAKTAEDQHTESIRKKIEATEDDATETNKLATEYQTLSEKAKLTADEQDRMDVVAGLLREKFPGLTQETIDLAAANKTLAEETDKAAKAQAELNLKAYLSKADPELFKLSSQMREKQDIIDAIGNSKDARVQLHQKEVNQLKTKIDTLQAERKAAIEAVYGPDYFTRKGNIPGLAGAGATTPTGAGGSTGGTPSTAIPQGTRLKDLDTEYKASIELANELGQNTLLIEEEYYEKRLALLGAFVLEDAKKQISVADSLKSKLAGAYASVGEEIDSTLKKQAAFNLSMGELPENEATQAVDVSEWVNDYLGTKAFESIMNAATEGLQAADVETWAQDYLGQKIFDAMSSNAEQGLQDAEVQEWITDHLGSKAFEALQAAATDGLQQSEVDEWTRDYLGKEAFAALQSAAEGGLQAADVQDWCDNFLGEGAFKALEENALLGLQAADVDEWVADYLGKDAFDALQSAAEKGLQSADVQEWCDDYLGKGAFDALTGAAEKGLQQADIEDWATSYLGDKAFQALSDAATLGLQEADVETWVTEYLGAAVFKAVMENAERGLQEADVKDWEEKYLRLKAEIDALLKTGKKGQSGLPPPGYSNEPRSDFGEQVSALSGFGDALKDIEDAWTKLDADIKEDANDWTDVLTPAKNMLEGAFVGAFETLGESVVTGTADWTSWGNAALKAFAGVLRSLAYQLLALAVVHTLTLDFIGAGLALAGAAAAGFAAGVVDGMADAEVAAHQFTDALTEQNKKLKENMELWTKSGKATEAYASVLGKIKGQAASFFASLQDIGTEITSALIDNLVNGFGKEDFLYAMQEYITKAVIKAAVFTESFMAEVAQIGTAIASGIANGFSEDELAALKARLATLYQNAADAAKIASDLVEGAFSSYAVGSLSVHGDQFARIHDQEMILPAGIAQEARSRGINIGPVGGMEYVGATGSVSQRINMALSLDGTITVDGREIGRVAFQHFDDNMRSAYGY